MATFRLRNSALRRAGVGPPADEVSSLGGLDFDGLWRDSSLDLAQGLEVDEIPIDSLPGDLRDSFE